MFFYFYLDETVNVHMKRLLLNLRRKSICIQRREKGGLS